MYQISYSDNLLVSGESMKKAKLEAPQENGRTTSNILTKKK